MVTLEINNSYSKISGLDSDQMRKLRNELSYIPGGISHFSRFPPRRVSLLSKDGSFPTGLHLRVVAYLKGLSIYYDVTNARTVPTNTIQAKRHNMPLRYSSQESATIAAVQNHRGGIVMPTGSGKSLVIASIAYALQVKTLVVTPNLGIKAQLQATMKEYGVDYLVTVENIDAKALQTAKNYDCLIIDECHHAAAKTYQKLNKTAWAGIYYRFFLSATFFRNQENEHLLFEGLAGQVIYELTYDQAVKKGYIVPVEAYVVNLPKTNVDGRTWASVYQELVVRHEDRNRQIVYLGLKLASQGKSVLILVKEIAHGKKLSKLSGIPFVNGQDEDQGHLKAFNRGEIKALIGTEGVIGEGVDTKPCEYVIIAGLGKARSSFMQKVGRALRTYPGKETAKIILIRDSSHKWTLSHYNAQKKILMDTYGTVPVLLEL